MDGCGTADTLPQSGAEANETRGWVAPDMGILR